MTVTNRNFLSENVKMKICTTVILPVVLWNNQVKKDEMGGACSTNGGNIYAIPMNVQRINLQITYMYLFRRI
jgi:hypothetical protein